MTRKNVEQYNLMRETLLNIANESPSILKIRSQSIGAGDYKKMLEDRYLKILEQAKQAVWYVHPISMEPKKRGPKREVGNKRILSNSHK
jgi:hypothetical protein